VRVDHDLAGHTLLAHVGPRVTTAPRAVALWTTELSKHPSRPLVRGFLWNSIKEPFTYTYVPPTFSRKIIVLSKFTTKYFCMQYSAVPENSCPSLKTDLLEKTSRSPLFCDDKPIASPYIILGFSNWYWYLD
jgi:hypothetical protein